MERILYIKGYGLLFYHYAGNWSQMGVVDDGSISTTCIQRRPQNMLERSESLAD
jgi:hypothetical protein